MAEYGANAVQTVNPGETIVFTEAPNPCRMGLIQHRDGSGNFLIKGLVSQRRCGCKSRTATYLVDFGANIAIPDGGTVEAISVAITIDGAAIPSSSMIVTPAAVNEYFNVSRAINANIFAGCCESVSIRNTSSQPILVQNANVIFSRSDLG